MVKVAIDKKMCRYCDFGDKDNKNLCISKMMGGNCRFNED